MFSLFSHKPLLDAVERSPLLSLAPTLPPQHHHEYEYAGGVHVVKQSRNETSASSFSNYVLQDVIPTVQRHHQGGDNTKNNAGQQQQSWAYQDLFSMNDIATVLSEPGLVHTEDYTIGKKVVRDGEEWFGQLPLETVSLDQTNFAVFEKGFSLVINKMEERWRPIRDFSYQILEELDCRSVSCNLYLTPPTPPSSSQSDAAGIGGDADAMKRSGFEVHLDWMDVFVVQMTGTKLWSVATAPLIEHATADLKRRPTAREISQTFYNQTYRDFLLQPGDVLYIPRGFLHNASTVSEDFVTNHMAMAQVSSEADGGGRSQLLPSANDARLLAQQGSMHLTFGVEHLCDTTLEALLHIAIDSYWKTDFKTTVATSNREETCDNQMVHLVVAEIARMYEDCDNMNSRPYLLFHDEAKGKGSAVNDDEAKQTTKKTASISCALRRSIPAIIKDDNHMQSSTEESCPDTETCLASSTDEQVQSLLLGTLEAMVMVENNLLQVDRTHAFYRTAKDGVEGFSFANTVPNKLRFCYPRLSFPKRDLCQGDEALDALTDMSESIQARLVDHLTNVKDFAIKHYSEIYAEWERHVQHVRRQRQNEIDAHLQAVQR
jgi:hypothetical protein